MSALVTRPGFSTASDPDDLPAVDELAGATAEPILAGWRDTALAATAVTLLNWPGWLQINRGLDPSWQAGLAIGFTHHLQWGPQLDFTYGPYGFAGFLEPFYRPTAAIAICFVFGVTWLLAYLLVAGLRRILPEGAGKARYRSAAVATVIALAIVWVSWAEARAADFVCVTGLGLALCLLECRTPAVRALLATLLGALTGFAVLVKLNSGIILAGLLVLALVGSETNWRERWRSAGLALAAFISVFAVAWAAAGQSFGNLPSFARASASLLLGYGTAMADSSRRASIPWLALAIVVVAGLVFAAAVWRRGKRQTLVAVLMLIGWSWAEVKEGFVSGNHFPLFFRMMLVAVALAALLRPQRAVFAGGLALAACLTLTVAHQPRLDPLASIRSFGTNLVDLLQPGRFAHMTANARARLLRQEPLARFGPGFASWPYSGYRALGEHGRLGRPWPPLGPRTGRPVLQCLHALLGPEGRVVPGVGPGSAAHPVLARANRLRLSGPVYGPTRHHRSHFLPLHPAGIGRSLASPATGAGPLRSDRNDRAKGRPLRPARGRPPSAGQNRGSHFHLEHPVALTGGSEPAQAA